VNRGAIVKRVDQVASLVFLGFSIWLLLKSHGMEYMAPTGPGPGFFPFWLGALLAVLSLVWLVRSSLASTAPLERGFVPSREGALRVVTIVVALAVFSAVVELFGFQLTMLVFLATLLMTLGRQKLVTTAAVSIAGSFGVYYAFTHWLDVSLPASSIDILRNIGL
jgi:putative tricarboxylic transport membrane protein